MLLESEKMQWRVNCQNWLPRKITALYFEPRKCTAKSYTTTEPLQEINRNSSRKCSVGFALGVVLILLYEKKSPCQNPSLSVWLIQNKAPCAVTYVLLGYVHCTISFNKMFFHGGLQLQRNWCPLGHIPSNTHPCVHIWSILCAPKEANTGDAPIYVSLLAIFCAWHWLITHEGVSKR